MTDVLLQLTLLTTLVSLVGYRLTRLIVEDAILDPWRKRHGIGVMGLRCDDEWYEEWPSNKQNCVSEFQTDGPYRDLLQATGQHRWPVAWLMLPLDRRFWKRVFSCSQCASVWVCGAVALLAVLVMAVATRDPVWLAGWLVIAPASAGVASVAL